MSRWMSIVGRLVVEDLRRMALPVALWLALLTVTGVTLWPEIVSSAPYGIEHLSILSLLLHVAGPLIAGLFVLLHPVDGKAFWRTRPWTRGQVAAAKAVEVAVFVWLPAVTLQLVLLSGFERPGLDIPWLGMIGDLALSPGAWILGGAAVGALTRSLESWLVGGFAVAVALDWARTLSRVDWFGYDFRWEPWRLAGLGLVGGIALASTYWRLDRRGPMVVTGLLLVVVSILAGQVPEPAAATPVAAGSHDLVPLEEGETLDNALWRSPAGSIEIGEVRQGNLRSGRGSAISISAQAWVVRRASGYSDQPPIHPCLLEGAERFAPVRERGGEYLGHYIPMHLLPFDGQQIQRVDLGWYFEVPGRPYFSRPDPYFSQPDLRLGLCEADHDSESTPSRSTVSTGEEAR